MSHFTDERIGRLITAKRLLAVDSDMQWAPDGQRHRSTSFFYEQDQVETIASQHAGKHIS
jgi:hypothetical protein